MLHFYVVIVSALVAQVAALPNGAPLMACESMTPFHFPVFFYQSNPPYSLEVSSQTASAGTPITVTLKTDNLSAATFKGYLIQARSGNSTTSIGTFVTNGQTNSGKLMSCPGGTANAVTHKSPSDKKSETFLWSPPTGFTGTVKMKATVVTYYSKMYRNILSNEITVS